MTSFKNILSQYKRVDTIDVDCGSGFSIQLASYHSQFKALGKEQARLRAAGLLKDEETEKKRKFATSVARRSGADDGEGREYVLGTKERDMDFFARNVIKGWTGAKDDDGKEIPYSGDMAVALLKNEEGGEELYNDLLLLSMDLANFSNCINPVEEDEKN